MVRARNAIFCVNVRLKTKKVERESNVFRRATRENVQKRGAHSPSQHVRICGRDVGVC